MKKLLVYLSLLIINLLTISCTKQAGVSTFISLGKIQDGSIEFSFNGAVGTIVNVGDTLRVKPATLTTVNAKIVDCKIKEGTTALPSGFSVNPLTCEIVGATLNSLTTTNYTLEVTNSLGKKSYASVSLRIRALLTFTGNITGLTAGQSVTVNKTVNGSLVDTQTFSSDGSYSLASIYDGDTYSITTIHNDSANYTCTPGISSATAYNNVVNNISCYGSGSRVLTANVTGLGSGGTVTLRMTSNSNTYDLTDAGNGANSFPALLVNDPYSVSVVSTSTGYGCYVQTGATGTITAGTNSVAIQCAANGPYYASVQVKGLNGSLISFGLSTGETFTNRTNGNFTFNTNHYYGNNATVTIQNTPLAHTCSIDQGTKQILGDTQFVITCTPATFTVGGNLTINGASFTTDLEIETTSPFGSNSITFNTSSSTTSFTFPNALNFKQNYEVFIKKQPANKICTLTNNTGTVVSNVSNISIVCNDRAVNDCSIGSVTPWSADGAINAMGCDGTYLYYGGAFNNVGPRSPGYAIFSKSDNTPSGISSIPNLGTISKVLSDGAGNWYISHYKDGVSKITMLNSDLSVNPNFSYSGENPQDFIIDSDFLYVRGTNSNANRGIYKINRFDGSNSSSFVRPTISSYRPCNKITISGDWLYCVGASGTINSTSRNSLNRFNKNSGSLDTNFNPSYNSGSSLANVIYVYDGIIYYSITGVTKAIDSSGNEISNFPTISNMVYSIEMINGRLTLGGTFTNRIMQLNPANNYSIYGDLGLTFPSGEVRDIHYNSSENEMYIVGDFTSAIDVSSVSRKNYLVYDLTTKRITNQEINPNGSVNSIAESNTQIMLGGSFSTIKQISRPKLARFKLFDGSLDESFVPSFNNTINDFLIESGNIYVGGDFTAKFDKINLATQIRDVSFTNPSVLNGAVSKILKEGTNIYLAGNFTQINAATRKYLAKVSEEGEFDSSFPDYNPNGSIYTLEYDTKKSCLLVGGYFNLPDSHLTCLNSSGNNIAFFGAYPTDYVANISFYDNGISNVFFTTGNLSSIKKYENLLDLYSLGLNGSYGLKNMVKIGTAIYFINYSTNKIQKYNLLTSVVTDVFNYANSSGFLYKVNDNLFYVNSAEEVFSIL